MTAPAPANGRGLALGAALVAALSPFGGQLVFAVTAIGVVGMAHGASDLALISPSRRAPFVAIYLFVGASCLVWWLAHPAIALPAFLAASAAHFAMEDAPDAQWPERLARGLGLVATPATLHATSLAPLLAAAGMSGSLVGPVAIGLAAAGGVCGAIMVFAAVARRDWYLFSGTAALLLLPPLVGFAAGFLILHALPQTAARRRAIGCETDLAYLRATWPVLLAAVALAGVAGAALLRFDSSGVRSLFAGIAALAMPHLLVMPWFEAAARADDGGPSLSSRTAFAASGPAS